MHDAIIKMGLNAASLSSLYPFRMSAIIFKGKRILSIGINEVRASKHVHRKFKKFEDSCHAEAMAISRMYPGDPKGASIFICRLRASGEFGNAKPCLRCQQLIGEAGIKHIYCTSSNPKTPILKFKVNYSMELVKSISISEIENSIPNDCMSSHSYDEIFVVRKNL